MADEKIPHNIHVQCNDKLEIERVRETFIRTLPCVAPQLLPNFRRAWQGLQYAEREGHFSRGWGGARRSSLLHTINL